MQDTDQQGSTRDVEAEFGARVKEVRAEKGWSQRDFAAALNLDASAVSRLEKGTRAVRLGEAAMIASALDVDLDYLVYGEDPFVALRHFRAQADEMRHRMRDAAVMMASYYLSIEMLLRENPNLFAALGDEHDGVETVDDYFQSVLTRIEDAYCLPDSMDRIVHKDEKRVRQITGLINAVVENVISTVDEPPPMDRASSQLRHPSRLAKTHPGAAVTDEPET